MAERLSRKLTAPQTGVWGWQSVHAFAVCAMLLFSAFIAGGSGVLPQGRTVRVGVYENPPKVFLGEMGQPSGIFIDLFEEIARQEGWNIEYVNCEWDACLLALEEGRIDLMPDVAYSPERDEKYDFHRVPVLESFSRLYSAPGMRLETFADLDGRQVAVLQGSIQQAAFAQMMSGFGYNASLVPVGTLDEGFALARDGKVQAAVANIYFGDWRREDYSLTKTALVFHATSLYFATLGGKNPDLLDAIDTHLAEFKSEHGSPYYTALRNWTEGQNGRDIPSEIFWALGILAGLLIATFGLNLLLRRQVKARTRDLELARTELEKREEVLRLALEASESGIWEWNPQASTVSWNARTCSLLGYLESHRELTTQGWIDMIHPNERELVEKQVRMVLQDPAHLFSAEYRMRDRNDEWVWILSRGKSVDLDEKGGSRRVAGTLINISALKKAEADLEESEDRFRTLFEHTAQGVVYQDGRGAIITANPAAERILGLSLDQMQGRTSMDPDWRAVHEDGSDYPGEEHAISIALRSGQPVQNQSMGIFNPRDGDTRWLIINAFPHFPPGEDTPDGAFATFEDITQRKRSMEELLKKTRELDQQNAVLSALLENLPLGVFMIEAPGGRPLLANPAALALLGRGILPGADSESLAEVYDAYRVPGRTHYPAAEMPIVQAMRGFSVNVEDMLVVQPDGKELLLAVHGSPVRDSEGRVWAGLAIFMNISERKKQEARLMEQMQELQSWHEAMLGREERILSLKEEVNQQLKLNGQPPRYGGTEEGIDG